MEKSVLSFCAFFFCISYVFFVYSCLFDKSKGRKCAFNFNAGNNTVHGGLL